MRARKTGHGLIELLVTLALTSAGVIGFIHMQHWREATEIELLAQIQASMLIHDMLRKININPGVPTAYRTAYGSPPPVGARCRHDPCFPEQLARFHVARWKCRLGQWASDPVCRNAPAALAALPAGDGRIALSGNGIDIAVRWLGADRQFRSFELNYPLAEH